ncbi:hypothetical protein HNP52_000016 [Sphingomonas kyeonggiensis]|jgi:hypothetical protein|uniref:ParB/Sulfiredoxin domain-containing protein n=1 Tax=Sphingomonas kyeonggiensis TaxID=1268553 RepID=A0A7W7JY91_9SPHN|nr:hypothetical protein [Sphingomonas kyeonggiensis]
MELKHIDIAKLSVSRVNMRGMKKAPDLTNILPSVRARGVLVPLIVRAVPCPEPVEGGAPDTHEIVAGWQNRGDLHSQKPRQARPHFVHDHVRRSWKVVTGPVSSPGRSEHCVELDECVSASGNIFAQPE